MLQSSTLFVILVRLLEGSESDALSGQVKASSWVTEERKQTMKNRLSNLKRIVAHLMEHMNEPTIDREILKEVRLRSLTSSPDTSS